MTNVRPPHPTPDFNRGIIDQLRANGGTILDGFFKGASLLVLSTTGARTGAQRENPLAYTRDGDRYVVIASNGGQARNPNWFHNLVAQPLVTLEVDGQRLQARARVAEGAERERLYDAQAAVMPGFADYQRQTSRRIPVVVFEHVA
jgi:deazaflavin-dependent oxidoreductase (nitroreductase family)